MRKNTVASLGLGVHPNVMSMFYFRSEVREIVDRTSWAQFIALLKTQANLAVFVWHSAEYQCHADIRKLKENQSVGRFLEIFIFFDSVLCVWLRQLFRMRRCPKKCVRKPNVILVTSNNGILLTSICACMWILSSHTRSAYLLCDSFAVPQSHVWLQSEFH